MSCISPAAWWWLRSANNTNNFRIVNNDGNNNNNNANNSNGVAVGFPSCGKVTVLGEIRMSGEKEDISLALSVNITPDRFGRTLLA